MRADRWRRVLERDQLFNDAPIDRTFRLGVLGDLLQIAGRGGCFDAGSLREFLEFCGRDVILVIADNLANPREVEGLPDARSVGLVLIGEGCVLGIDAGIEHRPDDVLAIHVEQGVRSIGLYGRNGSVERRRRDAVQRDLEYVAFASGFFVVVEIIRYQRVGIGLNDPVKIEHPRDDFIDIGLIGFECLLDLELRQTLHRLGRCTSRNSRTFEFADPVDQPRQRDVSFKGCKVLRIRCQAGQAPAQATCAG